MVFMRTLMRQEFEGKQQKVMQFELQDLSFFVIALFCICDTGAADAPVVFCVVECLPTQRLAAKIAWMSGRGLTANETAGQHRQELLIDPFSFFLVYDLSTVRQQNTPIVVYCASGGHRTSAISGVARPGVSERRSTERWPPGLPRSRRARGTLGRAKFQFLQTDKTDLRQGWLVTSVW